MEQFSNQLAQIFSSGEFSFWFLIASFLGGVISSLSPCSIGMLPLIIGYIGGYGDKDKLKTFIQLSSFVFGLSIIMAIIGIICAISGNVLTSIGGAYFILFLASFILIMGLNLLGIIELNFNPIIKKFPQGNNTSLFIYPLIIGALFALAASPCSTPVLASIMGFATLSKSILLSILMLLLFSFGQGLIIILAGIFTSFLKGIKNFADKSEILLKISGILLILASIGIYIKVFSKFFN